MLRKSQTAGVPPQGREQTVYWERAMECRALAEQATNSEVRDMLLELSNQWMQLVIHANSKTSDPTQH
jgi:hypothetical protein